MDQSEPDLDDDRAVELSSIAAIFPELIHSSSNPYGAILDLAVTPLRPIKICFSEPLAKATNAPTPPTSTEAGPANHDRQAVNIGAGARDEHGRNAVTDTGVHEIEHLPPLRLEVTLPDGYPAEQPPLVRLSVSPQWLSQKKLEELRTGCTRLWEELGRDQTVYMFIDNLQQEAESAFGLLQGDNVVPFSADLQLALLDFNLKTKREKFEKETFDCGICLEHRKGKDCHRLLMCGHVFCIGCLQDFYNNCIREGDVDNVKCTDPSCGKDSIHGGDGQPRKKRKQHTLNPSELLTIPIEQELVQRYVRLKRKKRLESDRDVIYCPRQWCQGPSRSKKHPKPTDPMDDFVSDSESEAEADPPTKTAVDKKKNDDMDSIPISERLCVCEDCDFAFCLVCKKSWHGELGSCIPRRKKELEEEEKASLAYLRLYSTPCPTCDAPCQKSHGCNHMICFKCNTHFCYLCSAWLSPNNPYQHFNTHGSNCYMRLWELEAGDGEGVVQREFDRWGEDSDDDDISEDDDTSDDDEPVNGADLARENEAIAPPFAFLNVNAGGPAQNAPAPPQERAIEFVNFAAEGGQPGGRRIIIPNQVEEPAPPAARVQAPRAQQRRRRPQGQAAVPNNRHPHRRERQQRYQAAARAQGNAANIPPAVPRAPLPPAAGNGGNAAQPVPDALRRFMELALRDEEDEWDSDELDEPEFGDGDDRDDNDDDDSDGDYEEAPNPAMRRIALRQRFR